MASKVLAFSTTLLLVLVLLLFPLVTSHPVSGNKPKPPNCKPKKPKPPPKCPPHCVPTPPPPPPPITCPKGCSPIKPHHQTTHDHEHHHPNTCDAHHTGACSQKEACCTLLDTLVHSMLTANCGKDHKIKKVDKDHHGGKGKKASGRKHSSV